MKFDPIAVRFLTKSQSFVIMNSGGEHMNIYLISEHQKHVGNLAYTQKSYRDGLMAEARNLKSELVDISETQLNIPLEYFHEKQCRPVVIVIGHTRNWLIRCCTALMTKSIHPLVISPVQIVKVPDISTISSDNSNSISMLCQYFLKHGRKRTAYYGFNPNSFDDVKQYNSFKICKKIYKMKKIHSYCDTYTTADSLSNCSEVFISRLDSYDSVICSNPISASILIRDLSAANIKVPDNILVAAIGSSPLSESISPTLTTVDVDFHTIGKKTIKLYQFLTKHTEISSLTANVQGKITPRASTLYLDANLNPCEKLDSSEFVSTTIQSLTDERYAELENIESMLNECDRMDKNMLYSLIKGDTIAKFAEENFVSENTVKYRLRNLIKASNFESRKALTDKLTHWLDVNTFEN